ncbi:MAG TPA: hypothetical protein VIA06_20210 [Candidatus Dormibacteraeota bacterium]|nr:hypothetical protein [Candidatus Dormibacteraeota bacterium]
MIGNEASDTITPETPEEDTTIKGVESCTSSLWSVPDVVQVGARNKKSTVGSVEILPERPCQATCPVLNVA